MHVYHVSDSSNDRSLGYWQAKTKGDARRAAIKHIEARRLDGSEIVAISKSGFGISDAATGQLCNAPEVPGPAEGQIPSDDAQLDAPGHAPTPPAG